MMNTPNYVYCNYRLNHGKWNKFLLNGLIFPFMQSHTHLYKVAGVAIDVEGKEMGEKNLIYNPKKLMKNSRISTKIYEFSAGIQEKIMENSCECLQRFY